jgi:hypothetical protein
VRATLISALKVHACMVGARMSGPSHAHCRMKLIMWVVLRPHAPTESAATMQSTMALAAPPILALALMVFAPKECARMHQKTPARYQRVLTASAMSLYAATTAHVATMQSTMALAAPPILALALMVFAPKECARMHQKTLARCQRLLMLNAMIQSATRMVSVATIRSWTVQHATATVMHATWADAQLERVPIKISLSAPFQMTSTPSAMRQFVRGVCASRNQRTWTAIAPWRAALVRASALRAHQGWENARDKVRAILIHACGRRIRPLLFGSVLGIPAIQTLAT